MAPAPLVASVVIPNFNYARFVGDAVRSALAQSGAGLEVVVVDDGSTDDSREVIASFGNRVRAVFKENGGQASAINAGCAVARGDVVFLLDADDMMDPQAVEIVLADWPEPAVLTQYRLRLVDAAGRPTRGTVPAHWIALDCGDLRQKVLDTGGYSTQVTSGLALRRDALARVLPIPEAVFRGAADGYLVRAMALLGPIHAIQRPLGRYRRHGAGDSEIGSAHGGMGAGFRKRILFAQNELDAVRTLARQHGLEARGDIGSRTPAFLLMRLGSLVADPARHPIPGDTRLGLLRAFASSQWSVGEGAARRASTVGLVSAVALLPRPLARRVLALWLIPAGRPALLSRLIEAAHLLRDGIGR